MVYGYMMNALWLLVGMVSFGCKGVGGLFWLMAHIYFCSDFKLGLFLFHIIGLDITHAISILELDCSHKILLYSPFLNNNPDILWEFGGLRENAS